MKIAVAGGTGLLGTKVVRVARERGHEVVVLSRATGVDLVSGEGLADALAGVDAVIDVSNRTTLKADDAVAFFTTATRSLHTAEQAAGVGHHVALSIVGVDRAPYAYYAGKLAQEREVESGQVPWTLLRATQFHEFAEQMLDRFSFAGLHLAPTARTQPVAADDVAARLVDLAEGEPAGRVADLAGPREEQLVDMVRKVAAARGLRGPVVPITVPGKQMAAMRRGDVLAGPGAQLTTLSFDEWLAAPPAN
ncbi:NAD(P)H-binding protein [Agromyces intestinalis]|uniref:NAD(P)H-binding protein n=1 Tax=Agromyces intestinalis TaxID=2592652 RepID=A0A5C1YEC1_9MICO|nr:NAD(P)H-binding protein [Agromyces intestinalis]QEO13785.1 NAD(P)H-binding protein [Agromyces intestinalis]